MVHFACGRRPLARVLVRVCVVGSVAILLPACGPGPKAERQVARGDARLERATKITIARSPKYQRAAAAYRDRNYRIALQLVTELSSNASLPGSDRAFLARQADICRKALGPSPISTPQTRTELSVGAAAARGDCGPRALALICRQLGVKHDLASLTKSGKTSRFGTSLEGLVDAARSVGLTAEGVQVDRAALERLNTPALAWVNGDHYVAVLEVAGREARVHDPNEASETTISTEDLLRRSGGILLTLRRS